MLTFYILLLLVAFLYASVGHGGASGYLALMALYGIAPDVMKPTALMLNLFVSLTAFIQFYRGGHFDWRLFIPFALASVPMSFVGGLITLDGMIYKKLLGVLLLLPVIRFVFFRNVPDEQLKPAPIAAALGIGGVIGLLSGMIGIGGGIILSPVLLLLKWANQKQAAAVSAMFIFVNSLSGLGGQLIKGVSFTPDMVAYVGVAFVGGLAGAYVGAVRFNHAVLKQVLAGVLAIASFKLLFAGI
ncbi:sulfite exporter TauE/SafE family protein [Chitinophaga horti]|uniref:Probable membrane transporter protein n=1 Tax=Chitinophaga horti TaxID=2920382 RepID=A0ABY6IVK4_9BACT|nr:sulfite exporter TauE/SafE family protein [Chitinophaga horti]UYQ91407.1 sulfite exporter TauE/SafE family protein [Chitinophaga horti]